MSSFVFLFPLLTPSVAMGLVGTILALLTNLGVRLFGIRAHVKGENDEMRRARFARDLEAQMLVTKGSSNQKGNKIEQVVVDASNVLRNDFGKAVLVRHNELRR